MFVLEVQDLNNLFLKTLMGPTQEILVPYPLAAMSFGSQLFILIVLTI